MEYVVKTGRVNIETLYVVEKAALLFFSVNLIAASLGVDKLSWSENSETEFVFGWNSWLQTDTNAGVIVIRDRDYSDCTISACSTNEQAGKVFFVLNMMALVMLACCCILSLEMAVFHYTLTLKKVVNAVMACFAFVFNLTAWANWSAKSQTSAISQANAGNNTMLASSFWYSVFASFFLFGYCVLVIKQNVENYYDKQKDREDAKPLPASIVPSAGGGKNHKNKEISSLLNNRIVTKEIEPAPPAIPPLPGRLSNPERTGSGEGAPPRPTTSTMLKSVPPPLPPRVSPAPGLKLPTAPEVPTAEPRRRSRGLPSVKASADSENDSEVEDASADSKKDSEVEDE
jgi:hypothetical protein